MYSIWQFAYSSPERLSQIMKIPTWNDLLYKSKMTASVSHPNTNIILRIRCRKHLGGCSSMAQLVKNPPAMQEILISRLERSSGEGKGYPLQCSGLENSMDCIVHGVTESRTQLNDFHFTLVAQWQRIHLSEQETWVWSRDWEDPLEKETATHFNILAWEISWTEEPGRLQSMRSQKSWTLLSD